MKMQNENTGIGEILDLRGAAKAIRCSASHMSKILNGKVPNVPPPPAVRAGRKWLIRSDSLGVWFKALEVRALEESDDATIGPPEPNVCASGEDDEA